MHIVMCASSSVGTLLVQWLLHLKADVTRTAVNAAESTRTILRVHDDAHSQADTKYM
jgi:NADPH:quinone reductase-like Zn-dependent oxidoreductase